MLQNYNETICGKDSSFQIFLKKDCSTVIMNCAGAISNPFLKSIQASWFSLIEWAHSINYALYGEVILTLFYLFFPSLFLIVIFLPEETNYTKPQKVRNVLVEKIITCGIICAGISMEQICVNIGMLEPSFSWNLNTSAYNVLQVNPNGKISCKVRYCMIVSLREFVCMLRIKFWLLFISFCVETISSSILLCCCSINLL